MVVQHPLRQNSTATAHNPGDSALHLGEVLDQQASVNRLIVNALLAMLFDDVKEIIFVEFLDRTMHAFQCLIHRNCSNRHRRCTNNLRAHLIQIHTTCG